MAADPAVDEGFFDTGQELITHSRIAWVRDLNLKDPKPPVTSGTITDDVSKKLHHKWTLKNQS